MLPPQTVPSADDARSDSFPNGSPTPSADALLQRCRILLQELEDFNTHLKHVKKDTVVELRQFRNNVRSEIRSLEKLSEAGASEEKTQHALRSSNLPFYEAVWSTAKATHSLVAFNKRFYRSPPQRFHESKNRVEKPTSRHPKKYSALVDVVAQDGLEWIKVSTITPQRLLFEMAKQGWELDESSSEGPDEDASRSTTSDGSDSDNAVSLIKLAEELSQARKAVRVKYRHPQVIFVLPKLREGESQEMDGIFATVRSTGATVLTASSLPNPAPLSPSVLDNMVGDEFANFSPVVNVDCTILLALVSDLSHSRVASEPWFHRATRRQIEMEEEENLLPASLYPAMGDRHMVCTKEAAKRMREIVDTIGTETERWRTYILMGDEEKQGGTIMREKLVKQWQDCSDYPAPSSLHFPITVVDKDADATVELPLAAGAVANQLTAINQSVFLYGWRSGRTTISSNRTVAKTIETVFEENRMKDDEVGPDIWLCPMARSLLGKEKGRKE